MTDKEIHDLKEATLKIKILTDMIGEDKSSIEKIKEQAQRILDLCSKS